MGRNMEDERGVKEAPFVARILTIPLPTPHTHTHTHTSVVSPVRRRPPAPPRTTPDRSGGITLAGSTAKIDTRTLTSGVRFSPRHSVLKPLSGLYKRVHARARTLWRCRWNIVVRPEHGDTPHAESKKAVEKSPKNEREKTSSVPIPRHRGKRRVLWCVWPWRPRPTRVQGDQPTTDGSFGGAVGFCSNWTDSKTNFWASTTRPPGWILWCYHFIFDGPIYFCSRKI